MLEILKTILVVSPAGYETSIWNYYCGNLTTEQEIKDMFLSNQNMKIIGSKENLEMVAELKQLTVQAQNIVRRSLSPCRCGCKMVDLFSSY